MGNLCKRKKKEKLEEAARVGRESLKDFDIPENPEEMIMGGTNESLNPIRESNLTHTTSSNVNSGRLGRGANSTMNISSPSDVSSMNRLIKIVLVGDTSVGKSCLIRNYLENSFSEDYEPTVLDVYKGIKNVKKRQIDIEIHDTSGDEHLGVNR